MIKLFTAQWCTPCQNFKKILGPDNLSSLELIDIDENPNLAVEANVRSIPCLIKYSPEGEELDRVYGAMNISDFHTFIS